MDLCLFQELDRLQREREADWQQKLMDLNEAVERASAVESIRAQLEAKLRAAERDAQRLREEESSLRRAQQQQRAEQEEGVAELNSVRFELTSRANELAARESELNSVEQV